MTWLAPGWFWLPLFFGFYLLYRRAQARPTLWNIRSSALAAAAGFAVLALARPALPQSPVDVERPGSDVIFAVDISRSMQAGDIVPSRLEAARALLAATVQSDERNRFGVIAFTTNPIILSPLTRDDELLLHLFAGLDTSMVMTRGTSIGRALRLARKLSKASRPIVVLLTDGGDETAYDKEAAWARDNGLVVDVVMLATASGSTLDAEDGKLLRDEEGGIVVTARNDAVKVLADATGGSVIEGADAGALSDAIARRGGSDDLAKTKIILYRELFVYPLAAALLAAMLGMTDLIARVRRRRG